MKQLTSAVLKSVSRSFYLSLRVLPSAVRPALALAYLLARAADTDPTVKAKTVLVTGTLRPDGKATGERLKGYSPSPPPAPARPPDKEKEQEKD